MGRGKGAVKKHNKDRKKKHKEKQREKKRSGQDKASGASTHSSVGSDVPPQPASTHSSVGCDVPPQPAASVVSRPFVETLLWKAADLEWPSQQLLFSNDGLLF